MKKAPGADPGADKKFLFNYPQGVLLIILCGSIIYKSAIIEICYCVTINHPVFYTHGYRGIWVKVGIG
jgi:hypothetical protein